MRSIGSHETVPRAGMACQPGLPPRACCGYWHNARTMSAVAENILRITITSLATLLIGLPAAWAALAIRFQAPGGPKSKIAMVVLWLAFSVAMLAALWQGRAGMAVLVFAAAFGALLFWW